MIPHIIFCIVLIALDQVTKFLAIEYIKPMNSLTVIPGIFKLTYVENQGIAFGLFQGGRWIFVGVAIIILIGIAVYYARLPKTKEYRFVKILLIIIAAGAIGNFIDRFKNGFVVDFLHASFIDFPVFNLADCYVVVGTISLMIISMFFVKENNKTNSYDNNNSI
jgi:signal peptidase II